MFTQCMLAIVDRVFAVIYFATMKKNRLERWKVSHSEKATIPWFKVNICFVLFLKRLKSVLKVSDFGKCHSKGYSH